MGSAKNAQSTEKYDIGIEIYGISIEERHKLEDILSDNKFYVTGGGCLTSAHSMEISILSDTNCVSEVADILRKVKWLQRQHSTFSVSIANWKELNEY